MAIDWASAGLDYVTHHEMTYGDIAAKYKAHPATIWKRAAQEAWTTERKNRGKKILEKANERAAFSQSEQLAQCNARHLAMAELEAAAEERLKSAPGLSENALRNLSVVVESAQRVSRLALGVSTENLHTTQDPYAKMTDQELAAGLERLGFETTLQ